MKQNSKFLCLSFWLKILVYNIWASRCYKNTHCYGTNLCKNLKIPQSFVKPIELTKMSCFNGVLNFKMGTDRPVFKSDGEGPARDVNLSPFCIDQTQVSNFQFYQFVLETNYKTEVFYNKLKRISLIFKNKKKYVFLG